MVSKHEKFHLIRPLCTSGSPLTQFNKSFYKKLYKRCIDIKPALIFLFNQWGFLYYNYSLSQYAASEQHHVEYVNF